MIEFSTCGYNPREGRLNPRRFEGRLITDGPALTRCHHPASFTGFGADGVVAVACFWHRHLLSHAHAIPSVAPWTETLTWVAENQAAMDALLDSPGGT